MFFLNFVYNTLRHFMLLFLLILFYSIFYFNLLLYTLLFAWILYYKPFIYILFLVYYMHLLVYWWINVVEIFSYRTSSYIFTLNFSYFNLIFHSGKFNLKVYFVDRIMCICTKSHPERSQHSVTTISFVALVSLHLDVVYNLQYITLVFLQLFI